jgi:hypothetical protein
MLRLLENRKSEKIKGTRRFANRQWTPEKIQELLIEIIQYGVNIFGLIDPPSATLAHLARVSRADRQFKKALETCGFDPKDIYSKSGVP